MSGPFTMSGMRQRHTVGADGSTSAVVVEDDVKARRDEVAGAADAGQTEDGASISKLRRGSGADSARDGGWGSLELLVPVGLTLVSAFTRFYGLESPRAVIFDEYHFGRFTNQYLAGTYLFDIHPPLGKLVLYWVARLVGMQPGDCAYSSIGDTYGNNCSFLALRATSATFGTLTTPLVYGIVRRWGGGVWAGILGALFFTFDNLNLLESRLILVDSQLIFWCAASLYVAQCWWARLTAHDAALDLLQARLRLDEDAVEADGVTALKREVKRLAAGGASSEGMLAPPAAAMSRSTCSSTATAILSLPSRQDQEECCEAVFRGLLGGWERHAWILAVAVTTSSALSIKWTALATPGMIAIESFFGFFFLRRRPAPLGDLLKILAVAAGLYFMWFAIHFHVLPLSGDGDAFMPLPFQRTLVGNAHYDPEAPHPGLLTSFLQLNQEMFAANARIDVRHHWESFWWEWPLNLRGVLYYSKDVTGGNSSLIYLLGNPAVIWLVAVLTILSGMAFIFYQRARTRMPALERALGASFFAPLGFCLFAYAVNLLPYILVARSAFVYHYLPALLYAEIMGALMVEQLVGRRHVRHAVIVLGAAILAVWLFFAPWVLGYALTGEGHARRRWYRRWD